MPSNRLLTLPPAGYWRMVAQELRNYCVCRSHESDVSPADATQVGLNPALFRPETCKAAAPRGDTSTLLPRSASSVDNSLVGRSSDRGSSAGQRESLVEPIKIHGPSTP